MRKLVSIRTIKDVNAIPNADAIQVATIDGWKVVIKKGEFQVGDKAVYFEIDSFLPETDSRYSFLMNKGVKTFNGVKGHVLRNVRLRGQLSQGLALPLSSFPELANVDTEDLSEVLGIQKWEPPIDASLAGQVKGLFPSFIRKTDQERCQNLVDEIFVDNKDAEYEVSMKLDGCSVTFYHNRGEVGVCSRNLELKINEENKDNSLVKAFVDSNLINGIKHFGNIAIQGELIGPKIQGNREKIKEPTFFVFDMQNLDTGEYLGAEERTRILDSLLKYGVVLQHVPILKHSVKLSDLQINSVADLLKYAEGPSINNPVREGLVFKRVDGQFSFKAISNVYLDEESKHN